VIKRDALKGFIIVYDFTTDVNDEELTITNVLAITKSAPNPFTTSTQVTFYTPAGGNVKVEVYNSMGSKVVTLADEFFAAGSHSLEWNGASQTGVVASGTYTIRVTDGATTSTQQVVLVR
jgi:flagellar hook assembly protein FlgD